MDYQNYSCVDDRDMSTTLELYTELSTLFSDNEIPVH